MHPDWTRRATLSTALVLAGTAAAQVPPRGNGRPRIVFLVHPGMVLLDLVGPLTVFNVMGADIQLAWKEIAPVATDVGLPVLPTARFEDIAPGADMLCIPGGLGGSIAMMEDAAALRFVAMQGEAARWVTSICTGGLVLGAAGLLRGRRATTHWYVRDLLPLFGAEPVAERVVTDGNRVTGGGVTAGLDFGLRLAAELAGEEAARRVQLVLEYAPAPPFHAGSPEGAGQALTDDVLARRGPVLTAARSAAERAGRRLRI